MSLFQLTARFASRAGPASATRARTLDTSAARSRRNSPSRTGAPGAHREAGFSLLEVLVAFVILALVAGALFELFGGALRNAGAAGDWSRAVLVAQSRLEEAASTQPLKPGTASGTDDDGRFAWQVSIDPYTPPDADPDLERASETMSTRLYRVSIAVTFPGTDGRSRSVTLSTLKLAARSAT
jgi:general secretion pathway protein I